MHVPEGILLMWLISKHAARRLFVWYDGKGIWTKEPQCDWRYSEVDPGALRNT